MVLKQDLLKSYYLKLINRLITNKKGNKFYSYINLLDIQKIGDV